MITVPCRVAKEESQDDISLCPPFYRPTQSLLSKALAIRWCTPSNNPHIPLAESAIHVDRKKNAICFRFFIVFLQYIL